MAFNPNDKVHWLSKVLQVSYFTKSKKGNQWEMSSLVFQNKRTTDEIKLSRPEGEWFVDLPERLSVSKNPPLTLQQIKDDFEGRAFDNFELF